MKFICQHCKRISSKKFTYEEFINHKENICYGTSQNPINLETLSTNEGSKRRSFTESVKNKIWNQSKEISGRSKRRWREDAYGYYVLKKSSNNDQALTPSFDHIKPHSKGGLSNEDNC